MRHGFRLSPTLFICCLTALLSARAADYPEIKKDAAGRWEYPVFCFTAPKGNWQQASNWLYGKPPAAPLPRVYVVPGASLTVDTPVSFPIAVMQLGFGGKGRTMSAVHFKGGAKMQVGGLWMPYGLRSDSKGEFLMEGGSLTVGDSPRGSVFLDVHFGMSIGESSTASGTGLFTISGGKLLIHSSVRVGALMPNTNIGIFRINGSAPSVTLTPQDPGGLLLRPSGTLEFVLDENGVSGIQAEKARINISEGALIRADGTAYRGPAYEFVLLDFAKIIGGEKARVEVVGFAPEYGANILFKKNRVILKVVRTK